MSSHYQKAYFLLSVAELRQLPPDAGIEIAIVGRSNAGKSSVLNRITNSKKLARVSKTPGRTQQINIFVLDEDRRLADLPGYGYAKVPEAIRRKWHQTIDGYFEKRKSLKGLILIMDIRHPLQPIDQQLLDYCQARALPVHIVLNKADKLSKGAAHQTLLAVQAALSDYPSDISMQIFSALKATGVDALRKVLDQWYGYS